MSATDERAERRRRPKGDHGVYFDAARDRYVAQATVGYDGRGKRIVKKGTGRSETAALRALRARIKEHEAGLAVGAERYTVKAAVEDWLELGHGKVGERTTEKDRYLARHVIDNLGARRVKDLTASEVERWLLDLARSMTTRTLRDVRSVLNRAVARAMARGMVTRNVVELVETPRGRAGRGARALSLDQARDVLTLTKGHWMYPYIVVSLAAGLRTEEVRALRWDRLDLEGDTAKGVPPSVQVWRSVRSGGDTKTAKSRRTLGLSDFAVAALKRQRTWQDEQRARAGTEWTETGLVFTTTLGTGLDAANVRRALRGALALVPSIEPEDWTPRDLRHSFVSLMSAEAVPLEEIARLVGHSGTDVTEKVYRQELRPVIQTGARVIDTVFADVGTDVSWAMDPLFSIAVAKGQRGA
ncbi:tyrosine recombinase XerC [Cellulosimicrobium sp. RS]|uniref:site-specific integrase n=1 Tax=Cellulosimicrobium sp. RS TaxID=3381347 RepID=UPI0038FD1FF2